MPTHHEQAALEQLTGLPTNPQQWIKQPQSPAQQNLV